jgi:hypothetical protein
MQKVIRHLIFILFLSQSVLAQGVLFEDKNNYMQDLKVLLGATKNQSIISLGTKFETEVWTNNAFDDIDKQKITEISKKMLDKKYLANGPFTLMLASLMAAVQNPDIGSDLMAHYIETLSLTIDYQDVNILNDYFKVSTLFFRKRALFDYYNNSCTIKGGTFDFAYAGVIPLTPDQNGSTNSNATGQGALAIPTTSNATPILMGTVQPTIEGPSIKFDNIDISLGSRFDSAVIHNTHGSFMFSNKLFVGNRGKFDWSLLGQDVAEIYVDFKEYNFNTTNNILTAENVEFFYPSKFESSVIGLFDFKSVRRASTNSAQYPKFTSLTNNVQLDHLSKNIVYTGGFSLSGKQFSSKCLDNKSASLSYNDGRNRFQTFSNNYNFGDSVITSDPTEIIIFIDRDTIWHPGVAFTLRTGAQTVRFHRDRGAYKNSLWHDTYHKLEFSVDLINWDLKSDSMNFDIYAAKSQIPAMFKSMNYFSDKEFTKLQVINNFHPLRILYGYMKLAKTDKLLSEEILKKNKNLTPTALAGAMIDLERKGFVYYDEVSGEIVLRPKAHHYMQSFIGKSDFDGIYIPSLSPEEVNATLDTKEFVLKIRGVERFYISDSSNVYAVPEDKIVKVYNNREILYNGRLVAGIFDMKGKNFRFNYQDFLVSMEKIDTVKFIMKEDKSKDKDKKAKDSYLDNNMVNASGTLYVNDPDNKSGKKNLPQYPKFDAATGAYVYFNSKKILGGIYNREVYFKIPPFKTDSVKGSDKKAVKFDGEFFSGGILPEFKETLKIMPDNALGFRHKVPTEGYDIFGGKAKFFGSLTLDHQGIRGDGELKYLSSTFYSNDFVFYPDSIIALGQQAKIKEQTISDVYYPDVDIADYEMKWVVKDDSMHLININHAFELYKKSITLEGTLNLTPRGLFGAGMMEIKKVNVISPHYEFGNENIGARHAVFSSKLPGNPKPSLSVNNMHINFNLKDSYADLSPEVKGLASMDFPMNQFKTSIENARWEMNSKIVTMSADENDISKSFFYSTNPEDDSLVFNGANATYDIAKNLLHISGVPFIKVFDTQIVPDSNAVTVYEEAQLKPFKNAKLVIDTLNGYHHLDRGKIEIISRNKFIGSAHYAFVNSGGDTMNIIFENFYNDFKKVGKRDSVKYTSSEAMIKDAGKFYIAPKILYKGKAKLIAPNKLLAFDGKVKIDIKAKGLRTDWFPYKNDGSSGDVVILLDKPKAKTKETVPVVSEGGSGNEADSLSSDEEDLFGKLHTGLFYEVGTNELYSTIVSTKRNEMDEEIFSATGQLIFDTHTNSFKIGPPKKLKEEVIAGNLYTYNDTSSILTAGGKFNLIKNDPNFSFTAIGESKGSITRNSFAANLLVSLKMNMPPKALNIMAKKMQEIFEIAPAVVIDSATQHEESMMMAKLANLENDKIAHEFDKNFTEDALYRPLFRYSNKLIEGICLANVHMNWSNQHKVWHNKTHLKLSNILETDINYKMKGYLEVKKSDQGDIVTLFLHPRSDVWFFFKYEPGRLSLLSSETDFMKAVTEKSKGESGTPAIYTFVQADFTEKQAFLKEFWKDYLGKEYNEEEEEKEVEEQVDADPDAAPAEVAPTLEATPTLEGDPVTPEPKGKKKEKKTKAKKDDIMADPSEQPAEETSPAPVEATPEGENTGTPSKKKGAKPAKKKKADITQEEPAETPAPVEATPSPVEATPSPVEATPTPVEAQPEGEKTVEPSKKKEKKPAKKNKADITQEETGETPAPVDATPSPVEAQPEGEKTAEPAKKKEKKPAKKKKTDITQEETEVTPEPVEATPTLEAQPEGENAEDSSKKKDKDKKSKKKKKGEGEENP